MAHDYDNVGKNLWTDHAEDLSKFALNVDDKVTISIYSADGTLVRTLALGNQAAGLYQNRNRAAYWDGKNGNGEVVASGVYFYTLTARNFFATRKMLILK